MASSIGESHVEYIFPSSPLGDVIPSPALDIMPEVDPDIPGEVKHEHGIATAHTFTEAMEKVVDWYGEASIINVYIENS